MSEWLKNIKCRLGLHNLVEIDRVSVRNIFIAEYEAVFGDEITWRDALELPEVDDAYWSTRTLYDDQSSVTKCIVCGKIHDPEPMIRAACIKAIRIILWLRKEREEYRKTKR